MITEHHNGKANILNNIPWCKQFCRDQFLRPDWCFGNELGFGNKFADKISKSINHTGRAPDVLVLV